MRKAKATQTLARIVTENEMWHIEDSSTLQFYTGNALCAVPAKTENVGPLFFDARGKTFKDDFELLRKKEVEYIKSIGANYLFVTPIGYHSGVILEQVSPFFIIREEESNFLKRKFYKDIPQEIKECFDALGIKDYEEYFKLYKEGGLPNNSFNYFNSLLSRVKEAKQSRYYQEMWKILSLNKKHGIDSLANEMKSKLGISMRFGPVIENIPSQLFDLERELAKIKPNFQNFFEFLNFVFSLPQEEQNIEANKYILQNYPEEAQWEDILWNVYSNKDDEGNANLFQLYTGILTDKQKEKFAAKLRKNSIPTNLQANVYLFNLGFDVPLEFLEIYKKEPNAFKGYFEKAAEEDKKIMIKALIKLPEDNINEDIEMWLSKTYPWLVDNVGRDNYLG